MWSLSSLSARMRTVVAVAALLSFVSTLSYAKAVIEDVQTAPAVQALDCDCRQSNSSSREDDSCRCDGISDTSSGGLYNASAEVVRPAFGVTLAPSAAECDEHRLQVLGTAADGVECACINSTFLSCPCACVNGTQAVCGLVITGCAFGGFVGFALGVPCFLVALGCGTIGIAAGSLAACFQGACGTPICFRAAQSAGMTGVMPSPCRIFFGLIGAAVVGAAGMLLPQCQGVV